MQKLEPTYLRYVYDSLGAGLLSADNSSSLPHGFVGLFEANFSADITSSKRLSLLRRFTIWSLFKCAVSSSMASEIIEEDEEDTKAFIDTYSKWFNSPEPGKYILYHDRLRTYFLQKLSSHEVQSLNEKLVSYLEAALEDSRTDEAQEYALEHLATHMVVESQLDNCYDRLNDFVNQEELWSRQVKVSKEYKWSQKGVKFGLKESSRRKHSLNTLLSAKSSISLQNEEQKNYKEIFNYIKNNDVTLGLERASNWKGEMQFRLYLIILLESLFGNLKDCDLKNDFFDEIVNKLRLITDDANNIKEIKASQSWGEAVAGKKSSKKIKIINWSDFFPQITMYYIHLELNKMGIEFSFIWKSIDNINYEHLINHNYGQITSKDRWLIPLLNDVLYKETQLDILLNGFTSMCIYALKESYFKSYKEYFNVLVSNILQAFADQIECIEYCRKSMTLYKALFLNKIDYDSDVYKEDLLHQIFKNIDVVKDFHEKRKIYNLIVDSNLDAFANDRVQEKLFEFYKSTKFQDDYKLQAAYEFSKNLFSLEKYKLAYELVIDCEVYDYKYLSEFLFISLSDSIKLEIANRLIVELESENKYEIPCSDPHEIQRIIQQPRGDVICQLAYFYCNLNNFNKGIELLQSIDNTKENDFDSNCKSTYIKIITLYSKNLGIDTINQVFNQNKFDELIINNSKYLNRDFLNDLFVQRITSNNDKIQNDEIVFNHSDFYSELQNIFRNQIVESDENIPADFQICEELCIKLCKFNNDDLLVDILEFLPKDYEFYRDYHLFSLCHQLLDYGRIEDAIKCSFNYKSEVFRYLISVLIIEKLVAQDKINLSSKLTSNFKSKLLSFSLLLTRFKLLHEKNYDSKLFEILDEIFDISSSQNNQLIYFKITHEFLFSYGLSNHIEYFSKKINQVFIYNFNPPISDKNSFEIFIPKHGEVIDYQNKKSSLVEKNDIEIQEFIDQFEQSYYLDYVYYTISLGEDLLRYFHFNHDEQKFQLYLQKILDLMPFDSGHDEYSQAISSLLNVISESVPEMGQLDNLMSFVTKHSYGSTVSKFKIYESITNLSFEQFLISNNIIVDENLLGDLFDCIYKINDNEQANYIIDIISKINFESEEVKTKFIISLLSSDIEFDIQNHLEIFAIVENTNDQISKILLESNFLSKNLFNCELLEINTLDLNPLMGRKLASHVRHFEYEDYVDENTGEVLTRTDTKIILQSGQQLDNHTIKIIIDYGISEVLVAKHNPIDHMYFNFFSSVDLNNSGEELKDLTAFKNEINGLIHNSEFISKKEIIFSLIDENQILSFDLLSRHLSKNLLFNEAVFFSKLIPEEIVAKKYESTGTMLRSIEIVYDYDSLDDKESVRSLTLSSISIDLLENNYIHESIACANQIFDPYIRWKLYDKLRSSIILSAKNPLSLVKDQLKSLQQNQFEITKIQNHYNKSIHQLLIEDLFEILTLFVKRSLSQDTSSKELNAVYTSIYKLIDIYNETDLRSSSFDHEVIRILTERYHEKGIKEIEQNEIIIKLNKLLSGFERIMHSLKTDDDQTAANMCVSAYDNLRKIDCFTDEMMPLLKLAQSILQSAILEPVVHDLEYRSIHPSEFYNDLLGLQMRYIDFANLSFDIFKIYNSQNSSLQKEYLNLAYKYSEKAIEVFDKTCHNCKVDHEMISNAWWDILFKTPFEKRSPELYHAARPNILFNNMLNYFIKKNDTSQLNFIIDNYASPNEKYESAFKDFKFIKGKIYNDELTSTSEDYKVNAKNVFTDVSLASDEDIKNKSCGEVLKAETINYETYKPELDGLFCEDIFGDFEKEYKSKCYAIDIYTSKLPYGHINLCVPVFINHANTFNRIKTSLSISEIDLNKIMSYECYIVIQPGECLNKQGKRFKIKEIITEDEYFDVLDSLTKENQYLDDKDPNKFVVKMGTEAILNLSNLFDFEIKSTTYVVCVLHPVLRPLVQLNDGTWASSDFNDLYRRLILTNNRLKRLIEIKAPEVILRKEKQTLQIHFDELVNKINTGNSEKILTKTQNLIKHHIYILSQLNDYFDVLTNKLKELNYHINKILELNNILDDYDLRSANLLKICEVILETYWLWRYSNETKFDILDKAYDLCEELNEDDFYKFSLLLFQYVEQQNAIIFYNKNKNKINTSKFSSEISDYIKDGRIKDVEYFNLLSTFNNNNILSHYILSEQLVNTNE